MIHQISLSIDVENIEVALQFYTGALEGVFKKKYNDQWQVVSLAGLDFHIQEKSAGTKAAGDDVRRYERHWTPIHLDFTVGDIRLAIPRIEKFGGTVESTSFSEVADIAVCADPFGNGFCLIRE